MLSLDLSARIAEILLLHSSTPAVYEACIAAGLQGVEVLAAVDRPHPNAIQRNPATIYTNDLALEGMRSRRPSLDYIWIESKT